MDPRREKRECFDPDELFEQLMAGNWIYVVTIYENCPLSRTAKVTRAKHTVLHLAVSEGDHSVVEQLVGLMADDEAPRVLALQNEYGDTPLHVAAALGLPGICALLAEKCRELVVGSRNYASETPLYMAAQHGKSKAFFALQSCVPADWVRDENHPIPFCRRGDGNTILHAAVHGEYFDLAFKIIHLYPSLVNFYNEMGETPLHLLANKPLVFRSGSKMRRIHKILYACIIVEPLQPTHKYSIERTQLKVLKKEDDTIKAPRNYATCMNLFRVLANVYMLIVSCFGKRDLKNCYIANEDSSEDLQRAFSGKDIEGGEENWKQRAKSRKRRIPVNYITAYSFLKFVIKVLMVLLGIGITGIEQVWRKKIKHRGAYEVMKELVHRASTWKYDEDGKMPDKDRNQEKGAIDISKPPDISESSEPETSQSKNNEVSKGEITQTKSSVSSEPEASQSKNNERSKGEITRTKSSVNAKRALEETPILLAAKRGVTEIVKNILDTFPVAIQDFDANHKNIVLLAVEHRHPQIYKLMLERKSMRESIFGMVDNDGNSALHLAARTEAMSRPWVIPGAALQMQWEIKWYKFVKNSMEPSFFQQYNNKGQTAREIFSKTHESLVKDGGEWLTNTSQSCSVVAALIATVAFASATTVPGGVEQSTGSPVLQGKPAFSVFAISALVALCFSVTSLLTFLSILTSRYQEMDFRRDLPVKVIIGLTSLFMSIGAMLLSFCAGHFFVVEDRLKYGALPIYIVTCLPATLFAISQFPLYVDLVRAVIAEVPERTYKTSTV